MAEGRVNSKITDSVTQDSTIVLGNAPTESMGLIDTVMAETLGMSMHNAISSQLNSQMSLSATITTACAKMLSIPIAKPQGPPSPPKAAPQPPPQPPPPPTITPLSGNPSSPESKISDGMKLAQDGMKSILKQNLKGQSSEKAAQADLKKMIDNLSQMEAQLPGGNPSDKIRQANQKIHNDMQQQEDMKHELSHNLKEVADLKNQLQNALKLKEKLQKGDPK